MPSNITKTRSTWTIKVKIPARCAPGKKTLRCQARYMICDAKTCSVPGRWTLPDVELTVAAGDAASRPPPKRSHCGLPAAARPGQEGQRRGDQARPGDLHDVDRAGRGQARRLVTFKVTAKLEPGYHIYQYAKTAGPGTGRDEFRLLRSRRARARGRLDRLASPDKHKDPNFPEVPFVEYYEDEVTWSIKLKVPVGHRAGQENAALPGRTT